MFNYHSLFALKQMTEDDYLTKGDGTKVDDMFFFERQNEDEVLIM